MEASQQRAVGADAETRWRDRAIEEPVGGQDSNVLTIHPPSTAILGTIVGFIFVALVILGSIATYLVYQGWVFLGDEQFEALFYLDRELGVPATVSMLGLAACALLLALLGAARHQEGRGFGRYWAVLALGFAYLAVDEGAAVHESTLSALLNGIPGTDAYSFLDRTWVIAGAVGSLIVGLLYIPFLLHLPRRFGAGMVLAGAMYVGGAVGFEMLSAQAHADQASARYMFFMVTEETLEMAGIALFLVLLWSLASQSPWRVESPALRQPK